MGPFDPQGGLLDRGSDTTHLPKFFGQIRIFVAVHVHTIHGLGLVGGTCKYKMPPQRAIFYTLWGPHPPKMSDLTY